MRTEINELLEAMQKLSAYLTDEATEKELETFAIYYPFKKSFDELTVEALQWGKAVNKAISQYQKTDNYLRYANNFNGFRAEAITCIKPKPTEEQVKKLWEHLQGMENPMDFHFQRTFDFVIGDLSAGFIYYINLEAKLNPTNKSTYSSGGGYMHEAFRLIDGNWIIYHHVSEEVWVTEQGYLTEGELWDKFLNDEMPYKVLFSDEAQININYEDI
jgi:hypothetical protein